MQIPTAAGDIFLTRAGAMAFGVNAQAMLSAGPFATALADREPAALAMFRKQARAGRIRAGEYWIWRESAPWLVFCVTQQRSVGAARPRYVESVMQRLARDFQREGLASLAVQRFGDDDAWPEVQPLLDFWLGNSALPVVIYTTYQPGLRAAEPWDGP